MVARRGFDVPGAKYEVRCNHLLRAATFTSHPCRLQPHAPAGAPVRSLPISIGAVREGSGMQGGKVLGIAITHAPYH